MSAGRTAVLQMVEARQAQPPLASARGSDTRGSDLERNTATIEECAAVWGVKWNAARMRVQRSGWHCARVARADGMPGEEVRPWISDFSKSDQRALRRMRRKKERETAGLPGHPGGLVVRENDKRLALTAEMKELIWDLYTAQEAPGYAYVFERFTESCPSCGGAMELLDRGADGRYKTAKCVEPQDAGGTPALPGAEQRPTDKSALQDRGVATTETRGPKAGETPALRGAGMGCGFRVSYATVRRACIECPPAWAAYRREGYNAWKNKFGSYGRVLRGEHRNDLVESDGNDCDLMVWEPERPWSNAHQPRLIRPCAIVWQDTATGVVSFAVGYQETAELVMLAFHHYAKQWGLPRAVKTDNGKAYEAEAFEQFLREHQVDRHHFTLPSQRGGESHAKSKAIERWFRTMTEGFVKYLPGYIGSHPKQRQEREHVLYPMRQAHQAFLDGKRAETPFLTLEEYRKKLAAWVAAWYHARPTKRLDCSPHEAFMRDAKPIHRIGEQELQILLLARNTRKVGRNGVDVNGVNYWHPEFAQIYLKGQACTVRQDPEDLGWAYVTVHLPDGDTVVRAEAPQFTGVASEDMKEAKHREKAEREALKTANRARERRMEGMSTLAEVLEEKALRAPLRSGLAAAAGGSGSVVLPLTEGHRIARAISHQPLAISPANSLELTAKGSNLKLGPTLAEMDAPPPKQKPIFTTAWEREQWEAEHGDNGAEDRS